MEILVRIKIRNFACIFLVTGISLLGIAKGATLDNASNHKSLDLVNTTKSQSPQELNLISNGSDLIELEATLKRIELENSLNRALLEQRLTKEFANDKLEIEKLKMERELSILKYEIEKEQYRRGHQELLNKIKDQKDLLQTELELAQVKMLKELEEFNNMSLVMQKQVHKLNLENDLLKSSIETQIKKKEFDSFIVSDENTKYADQPFHKNGKLLISDRRIDLNGVISPWKASYIERALSFYNNKSSKHPIFLIIESSPGGSVAAGHRIISAIKSSKAPVYVVLKSFAASMAAVIITLADNSFAYPNAVILHHQPHSTGLFGLNVREAREFVRRMDEVNKRLLGPVAKKMGISLEDLDKKFYEKSVDGDWMEYADDAKKIKWVNNIVLTIDDYSIDYLPSSENYTLKQYYEEYYRYGMSLSNDNIENKNRDTNLKEEFLHFDYDYSYKPRKEGGRPF